MEKKMMHLSEHCMINILKPPFVQMMKELPISTLESKMDSKTTEVDLQEPIQKLMSKKCVVEREIETEKAYATLNSRGKEDYWSIDFVCQDSYGKKYTIPIEFKYCEENKNLVLDDMIKVESYLKHFEDVYLSGLLMIYDDNKVLNDLRKEIKEKYPNCKTVGIQNKPKGIEAVFVYLEKKDVECVTYQDNLHELCVERIKNR